MNESQDKKVKNIQSEYAEKTERQSKFEELMALDGKVKRPAEIFAYSFGTVGALILGVGMCLTMKVIGAKLPMAIGVVIGCLGIVAVSVNYFIYRAILNSRKNKYRKQIMRISDELLNNPY